MSYADLLQADVRLVILRTLAELPANRGNSSVLCSILDSRYGHAVTADGVALATTALANPYRSPGVRVPAATLSGAHALTVRLR